MPDLPAHGMSSHQVTMVEVLVWWLTWAPRGTSSLPLSEQDISQSSCSTTVQPLVSSATLARPSRCSLLRPSLSLTPDLGYNIIRNQPPRPQTGAMSTSWVVSLSPVSVGPSPRRLCSWLSPVHHSQTTAIASALTCQPLLPLHNTTLLCSCPAAPGHSHHRVLFSFVLHCTAPYCTVQYQQYENLGQNIILRFTHHCHTAHCHLQPLPVLICLNSR